MIELVVLICGRKADRDHRYVTDFDVFVRNLVSLK